METTANSFWVFIVTEEPVSIITIKANGIVVRRTLSDVLNERRLNRKAVLWI